jgi:uncharacterized membrane-anchored protein
VRRRLFLLGVLLHAAVLVGWAASLEISRARSMTVRLEVVQRDPRDLLRGDYIWLNYAVSDIPVSAFASPPDRAGRGEGVYVALAPKERFWEVAAASLSRETLPLAPDHRLLVGTLEFQNPRQLVHVLYGIERYYVPEGKGNPPPGKIEAEVALTADGRPLLTRLFVDGRPYP